MAIDTLKIARRLQDAGFNEAQAEALIAAVQAGAEGADFATRADLAVLRGEIATLAAELRGEIATLAAELRAEIAAVRADVEAAKAEMLMRMLQMILGAVLVNIVAMLGVMFAFAKLLGH